MYKFLVLFLFLLGLGSFGSRAEGIDNTGVSIRVRQQASLYSSLLNDLYYVQLACEYRVRNQKEPLFQYVGEVRVQCIHGKTEIDFANLHKTFYAGVSGLLNGVLKYADENIPDDEQEGILRRISSITKRYEKVIKMPEDQAALAAYRSLLSDIAMVVLDKQTAGDALAELSYTLKEIAHISRQYEVLKVGLVGKLIPSGSKTEIIRIQGLEVKLVRNEGDEEISRHATIKNYVSGLLPIITRLMKVLERELPTSPLLEELSSQFKKMKNGLKNDWDEDFLQAVNTLAAGSQMHYIAVAALNGFILEELKISVIRFSQILDGIMSLERSVSKNFDLFENDEFEFLMARHTVVGTKNDEKKPDSLFISGFNLEMDAHCQYLKRLIAILAAKTPMSEVSKIGLGAVNEVLDLFSRFQAFNGLNRVGYPAQIALERSLIQLLEIANDIENFDGKDTLKELLEKAKEQNQGSPEDQKADLNSGVQEKGDKTLVIEMEDGKLIEIELYSEDAPQTVSRIVKLASEGFYNGLTFHRVIPGFVAQGGDPKGDGTGGSGVKLKHEDNNRKHIPGAVALSRGADPDSGDSQFYISLGTHPHLDRSQTVFGQVTVGMEHVKGIEIGDKMKKVFIK